MFVFSLPSTSRNCRDPVDTQIGLCVQSRSVGTEIFTQRLLGLSMEDPTTPLDTPEVVGGLKTRLFEGPKSTGSLWVVRKGGESLGESRLLKPF